MTRAWLLCSLLFVVLIAAPGCDAWTSGPDPIATRILDVRADPNPVVVGDTTTFTVVISDSTAPGLNYYWGGVTGGEETTEPHLDWIADAQPGEHSFRVRVTRSGSYEPVQEGSTITVISTSKGK